MSNVSSQELTNDKDYTIYKKIYDIILSCGFEQKQMKFLNTFLNEIRKICTFSSAWVVLIDNCGNDIDWIIYNDDPHWRWLYHDYYKKIPDFRYKEIKNLIDDTNNSHVILIDWSKEKGIFVENYIYKKEITYSIGFPIFDHNGLVSAIFRLDTMNPLGFFSSELEELKLLLPPINLIYKYICKNQTKIESINKFDTLTSREKEISSLLCSGVPINKISTYCNISTATVRKHIENIYKKVGVNSLQEFLILMLKI